MCVCGSERYNFFFIPVADFRSKCALVSRYIELMQHSPMGYCSDGSSIGSARYIAAINPILEKEVPFLG